MFCPGKSADQVVAIVSRLAAHHANVVATRCDAATAAAVEASGLACVYHPLPRLLVVRPEPSDGIGLIAVGLILNVMAVWSAGAGVGDQKKLPQRLS